ncbi:MAG TPA: hypothetical protein DCS29_01515 [Candidatus Magasanikbacteria bacterium]|nr:MAG: hypothetical protein A2479_04390 [Candidatus Magasanikbacteria bacterium RIFOXYC2_FULL_39_8]HAT03439.1 hypothetical protein [Candidatus Magasanikbacteria bacterium]
MLYRINGAVIPAGLIRSAKTYSLIADENGLYIFHTGPAGRHVRVTGSINNAVVDAVRSSQDKKVAQGESRIDATPLEELLKEKGNVFVPRADIVSVNAGKNIYDEQTLEIVSKDKTWKFHFFFLPQTDSMGQFVQAFK